MRLQSELHSMPDLIHLAIPAFILLVVAEAIVGAGIEMWRDLRQARSLRSKLMIVFGNPGARRFGRDSPLRR
jgi:hypothetical protein